MPVAASLRRCIAALRRPLHQQSFEGVHGHFSMASTDLRGAMRTADRKAFLGHIRGGALSMPSTSTLPSARLPARRCVCKYSGEAESGSPWHRAPGTDGHRTAQHRTAQSIEFTVASGTPAAVLLSSCLRISQNWMKETECSPENFAGQKRPKSLQHLQRLSNLPSLIACIAHCAHCTHCIDQLICDLHLQLPCASCRSA